MDKEELVALCKKGESRALDWLYRTYSGKMMKVCLHYVSDRQVAQDLLHDGFILIFTSIRTLRDAEKLESWMATIMRNLSLRYLNDKNAVHTVSLSDVEEKEEPAEPLPSTEFPPYPDLLKLVERLPDGYRTVFKLAVLEGMSHGEIASVLGIAPHSSSSQLSRAKLLLRKMLAGYPVMLVLLLLFFFSVWYDYRKRKDDREARWSSTTDTGTAEEKETEREEKGEDRTVPKESPSARPKPPCCPERPSYPALKQSEKWLAATYTDSVPVPVVSHHIRPGELPAWEHRMQAWKPEPYAEKKKGGKWKVMLAGSVGPELARNLYKLIAVAGSDAAGSASRTLETWEEYYAYLNGRYEAGGLSEDSVQLMNIARNNNGKMMEHRQHDAPVTVGLSFSKNLNGRWSLETGVRYTYLKSTFTSGDEFAVRETQKLHYIGIPLRLSYRFWNHKRFSAYATAGVQLDIPLKGTLETVHVTDSVLIRWSSPRSLEVPWQWSVQAGAGVQYHFTPHVSFYVEPTFNYYIPDGSSLRTIRKEHPFTFTVPVGFRFSW